MIISLDFELMWGILDHKNPMEYKDNIMGVWDAIPKMLNLFNKHNIHATWGTVGLIARENMEACESAKPDALPEYIDTALSPYSKFSSYSDSDKKLFFSDELIKRIIETDGQELGSHTYSHYYCMEQGQTENAFMADLELFQDAMSSYGCNTCSIIFPRNQFNCEYSDIIKRFGIKNYRGNEKIWFDSPSNTKKAKNIFRRALRLADNYINISGHNCYDYTEIRDDYGLNNIRSSRFLRPYSKMLAILDPIRLCRIKSQMKYAAKHNMVFHLWWHPHNFGVNTEKNIAFLEKILLYYEALNKKYGMRSLNMGELGDMLD